MAKAKATISVKGLKINTLLSPAAIPADLVPPEPQSAGNPVVDLQFEDSPLVVRASLNGKSVRRAIKMIAEHDTENVNVVLQGTLKPAPAPREPSVLEGAWLAITPKTPKQDTAAPETQ